MPQTIKCLNSRIEGNEKRKCLRYLAEIPDCVYDTLKVNPKQKLILRCSGCSRDVRWVAVYYDKGYVFETLDEKPEFQKPMQFDKIISIQQVG